MKTLVDSFQKGQVNIKALIFYQIKDINNLAPIALFAYNRPWHTKQTIEALQKNILASDSDLIIFSDDLKNSKESRSGVLAENSLIFFEYSNRGEKNTGVNDFYTFFHSEYKNPFQDLVYNNRKLFDNMFLWENKFFYYVFDKNGKLLNTNQN